MQTEKISRELTMVETRTMLAERNHGKQALPRDPVVRAEVLLRRTLGMLSAEDRQLVMDESDVIRIEHPTETDRMRRRIQSGEDRVPDRDDRDARRQYFKDWAATALAGMTHAQAAEVVGEVSVGSE